MLFVVLETLPGDAVTRDFCREIDVLIVKKSYTGIVQSMRERLLLSWWRREVEPLKDASRTRWGGHWPM